MDDPCPRLIVRSRLPAAVQRYPTRHSWSFAEEPSSMFAALGKERPCSANGAYNGKTGSRICLHRFGQDAPAAGRRISHGSPTRGPNAQPRILLNFVARKWSIGRPGCIPIKTTRRRIRYPIKTLEDLQARRWTCAEISYRGGGRSGP